jgi:hypothetical protein
LQNKQGVNGHNSSDGNSLSDRLPAYCVEGNPIGKGPAPSAIGSLNCPS